MNPLDLLPDVPFPKPNRTPLERVIDAGRQMWEATTHDYPPIRNYKNPDQRAQQLYFDDVKQRQRIADLEDELDRREP